MKQEIIINQNPNNMPIRNNKINIHKSDNLKHKY